MPKILKIILSALFVLAVAFFTAKGCVQFYKEIKVSHPAPSRGFAKAPAKKIPAPPGAGTPQAKMAIILDDWGPNRALLKDAIEIGRPLTLSVLPNLPYSREIAQNAKKNGLGVMLHLPMQAQSLKAATEPHTILTTMPDAEIIQYLEEALAGMPEAEGVNNHQGSAATSDPRVMETVLKHLKSRGLFFVDSHVVATTVGAKVAKSLGVPFTSRDVFIDNQPTVEAVKGELRKAGKKALSNGRIVVIGHDKKVTLQAIRETLPELERHGVKLVLVKELLE